MHNVYNTLKLVVHTEQFIVIYIWQRYKQWTILLVYFMYAYKGGLYIIYAISFLF